MNKKNICKFVSARESLSLITHNFIFETVVPHSGETCVLNKNILYLVTSGSGLYKCGDRCHSISVGCAFFSFADHPFCIENINSLEYYFITFSGDRSDSLLRRFGITAQNCIFEVGEGIIPLWQDSHIRSNDDNIDLLSESLLLYTFSKLTCANNDQGNNIVSRVVAYLDENFTKHDITLSSVAASLGYNEKYMSHIFKRRFGMGFSEYLRLLRIKHAVILIENGVTSVKNVAALSGYTDPLYFSKIFSESMGVSPSEYRKNKKG